MARMLKVIVNDLNYGGYGRAAPFFYVASFFFLTVFICANLFIVTVLDNFANLCTMDDTNVGPDVSKDDEFCIKNKELCITNKELCIENDELCLGPRVLR